MRKGRDECLRRSKMGKRLSGASTVDFLFIFLIISFFMHLSGGFLAFICYLGILLLCFLCHLLRAFTSKINPDTIWVMPLTMELIYFGMKWVPMYWVFLFVCLSCWKCSIWGRYLCFFFFFFFGTSIFVFWHTCGVCIPCLREFQLINRRTYSCGCAPLTPTLTPNSKLKWRSRTRSSAIAPRSYHTSILVSSLLSSLFSPLLARTTPSSLSYPSLPSAASPVALKLAFRQCSTPALFLACGAFLHILIERLRMLVLVPLEWFINQN